MSRTHARISADKLGRDGLAGFESGRFGHVDQYVTEFVADVRAVEDDTSLDDSDDPLSSVRRQGSSSYGRTRNVIAADVKSGGAGSEGRTSPAGTLSARYDKRLVYLLM
jgi:hypothetical protein